MPLTSDDVSVGSELLALLADIDASGADPGTDAWAAAEACAHGLGLDPDGSFCVAALVESDAAAVDVAALPGPVVTGSVGGATVLLVQGADATELSAALGEAAPDRAAGISAVRSGLAGVRLCLVDARQALALAQGRGTTVRWEDCWWLAVLTDHVDQLRGVVTPTWTFAAANTHLTDAVEAYADESFSSTRAARRLFVHPNTVLYRLRQWHRNTGLNPSGISGLATSVAAVELGRLVDRDEAAAALKKP